MCACVCVNTQRYLCTRTILSPWLYTACWRKHTRFWGRVKWNLGLGRDRVLYVPPFIFLSFLLLPLHFVPLPFVCPVFLAPWVLHLLFIFIFCYWNSLLANFLCECTNNFTEMQLEWLCPSGKQKKSETFQKKAKVSKGHGQNSAVCTPPVCLALKGVFPRSSTVCALHCMLSWGVVKALLLSCLTWVANFLWCSTSHKHSLLCTGFLCYMKLEQNCVFCVQLHSTFHGTPLWALCFVLASCT